MKVSVIPGKCTGHARCAAVAPDVYQLSDDGFLEVSNHEVPAGLERSAVRGARACPERAIQVIEDQGSGA